MDLGIYTLSFALSLLGEPGSAQYVANIERGIDTSGVAVLKYDGFTCVAICAKDYGNATKNCSEPFGTLDEYLDSLDGIAPIPDVFANQLAEQLQRYFVTGGMPEVVSLWADSRDVRAIDQVLGDLLDSYERDFAKHSGRGQFARLSLVWNSLPRQLARENKKFMWGLVRGGPRPRVRGRGRVALRRRSHDSGAAEQRSRHTAFGVRRPGRLQGLCTRRWPSAAASAP